MFSDLYHSRYRNSCNWIHASLDRVNHEIVYSRTFVYRHRCIHLHYSDSEKMDTDRSRRKVKRAEVVAEYKERTKKLRSMGRNEDPSAVQDILEEELKRCNELYPVVKKKLDGTAADSKYIRELVNLGQEASKRINANSRQFDLRRIIRGLMNEADNEEGKKLSWPQFARYITEKHVSTFLCCPPTFEFFYGALKVEDLVIKEKRRRVRERIVETKSVTAKEKNIEIDVERDSTPKEVEHINKQLNRLLKDKREGISFFKTLVDPRSFTQTVENIFHVSFLVKEGKVGIKPDSRSKAVLTSADDADQTQSQERERAIREGNQSILSFSMEDYDNWKSAFKIDQRAFAPRSDIDN